jgi:hypothetical protein
MLLIPSLFRKDLVAIAEADSFADDATVEAFVADMTTAGLYAEASEDDIERLDNII